MISSYLIAITALGAVLFVVGYAILAPFYRSEEGWNVMTFMVVVVAMVIQAIYFRIHHSRAPEWLSIIDWGLVAFVVWWRLILLARRQLSRQSSE
jgi:drug/metabolite transporter (DMT)-like permease